MVASSAEPPAERTASGWGLLGALAFCACTALAAALDTPLQLGRQKRTMGDMRTIATAFESYALEHDAYPATRGTVPVDDALARMLEPTYVKRVSRVDGWGTPYLLHASTREYTVRAFMRDRVPDPPGVTVANPCGGTTSFDADLIFATGSFVQYPHGGYGC